MDKTTSAKLNKQKKPNIRFLSSIKNYLYSQNRAEFEIFIAAGDYYRPHFDIIL